MKKLIISMLILLAWATSLSAQSGQTGPLTWVLDLNSGTLTISGNGAMPNYEPMEAPWSGYGGWYIEAVVIENGVTTIGNNAFMGCAMTSIAIPNSVTTIGEQAFSGCYYLLSITIPNGITTIGKGTFHYCGSLSSIIIPHSVTTIKEYAFFGCDSLTSITIPNGVTTIGDGPFANCASLTSIDVESGSNSYCSEDGVLFDKSKTTLVCYPAGKTDSYIIPNSVTIIGGGAFSGCENLPSIIIPEGVKTIRGSAFAGCTGIASITLPNSVKTIGESAFSGCINLTSMTIPDGVTSINKGTFYSCVNLTSITLPNSLTTISMWAFSRCYKLTSITIPGNVTSIGLAAFYECMNLTSITNLNLKPIAIYPDVFYNVPQSICKLKVPTSAVSAYQNADVWENFNIEGGGILVNTASNFNSFGYTEGAGLYEENETAYVIATARDGYKFVNWTIDGEAVSDKTLYRFTVTENVKLVANFEREVGIEELQVTSYELQVYPNPTRGEIQVTSYELQVTSVEVFDVFGRNVGIKFPSFGGAGVVKSPSFGGVRGGDISHLPTGIYFLRIQTEIGMITRKIIKR